MKHVKRVTVAPAQQVEIDTQTITFWVWIGSMIGVIKQYG
jgi:hypothetical protein